MTLVDTATSPTVAARTALAAAIESATGHTCHPSATLAIASPCIVLTPAGWQYMNSANDIYRVTVTCLYATKDVAEVSNGVEELARAVYQAGRGQGWRAVEVPAPGSVTFGTGDATREYAGVQFEFTIPLSLES